MFSFKKNKASFPPPPFIKSLALKVVEENDNFTSIRLTDSPQDSFACYYLFPDDFLEQEIEQNWLKKRNMPVYEIINTKFQEASISLITPEEGMSEDFRSDIFAINFNLPPRNEVQKALAKGVLCTAFIFLVHYNGYENPPDDTRIFLYSGFSFSIYERFWLSELVEDNEHPAEKHATMMAELQRVIAGLAEHFNTPMTPELKKKFPDKLLVGNPTREDFRRLLSLLNYNPLDEDLDKLAQEFYDDYNNDWADLFEELNEYRIEASDITYFPSREYLVNYELNGWTSDWKFDADNVCYFIGEILGEEWTFDYPEETYSHNLFPYIQKALAERGLALMGFDMQGDDYAFFLVRAEHVKEILTLSNRARLGIEHYS